MLDRAYDSQPERALAVHQRQGGTYAEQESMDELCQLVTSAGARVVGRVESVRRAPNPATFLGSGKVAEISELAAQSEADVVVVNHAISPIQERNLERALKCRVLDRTGLILDIFAQRAASREGKLQVELAQLRHLSTRLVRGWTHLERQKGGIGLRGPGETQLETDRRLIVDRIRYLNKRLRRVSSQREMRRRARSKVPIATVCLVGYTNAGKSSLFNRLTGAEVLAEDQLFATLDPTMRRVALPDYGDVVLSDTVGFIRHLPHSLIQAFHSTLEEVNKAALLLHVVDSSTEARQEHVEQVNAVLKEIGAEQIPRIMVYNKIDRTGMPVRVERNHDGFVDKVCLSAHAGHGTEELLAAMAARLGTGRALLRIRVPPQAAELRAFLFEQSVVKSETYTAEGDWIAAVEVSPQTLGRLQRQPAYHLCHLEDR